MRINYGASQSNEEKEDNHVGLAFRMDISDVETADSLSTKEFRRGKRAPNLKTVFKTSEELAEETGLETWSKAAAEASLFGE